MARKRQSSGSFNTSGFDGVDMAVDLGEAIDRWRGAFVSSVGWGKYARAAGWAVDETAKAAVTGIRAGFDKHLKRQAPWTKSAVVYKRLSKSDLRGLERGERQVTDVFAQVYVKPKQSIYLKYLFGLQPNVRLQGDVGLAQRSILIPWWDNITATQGVRPTATGRSRAPSSPGSCGRPSGIGRPSAAGRRAAGASTTVGSSSTGCPGWPSSPGRHGCP